MSLTTSTHFASCIASGTDWRDTSKEVLEQLQSIRTSGDKFNIGFIYVSDQLAGDMESIVGLFRSVLNIEQWTGTVGIGVCGNGQEIVDRPAISAMIGYMGEDEFCFFEYTHDKTPDHLKAWLAAHPPMLMLAHADPAAEEDPALVIENLSERTPLRFRKMFLWRQRCRKGLYRLFQRTALRQRIHIILRNWMMIGRWMCLNLMCAVWQ